jgi:outer membrane lipoprotein carrier protein
MILDLITRAVLGVVPAAAPAPAHHAPPLTIVNAIPLAGAPGLTNPSANDVVDQVQKFYANIKQVSATFRQAVTNVTFGSTKSSDGSVWILKPGKMRWDYVEKKNEKTVVKKSFISNGTNLWVVEHDNMQVIQKNLQQDLMPVAVTFLYGKGDLKTEFNAEFDTTKKYGEKGDLVLRMMPKRPSAQYKNLFLVVSPTDYHVTQSVIVDSSNNVNHFRFFAPDFEKPIKDIWFEFDERSVKNYRVIDADASRDGLAGTGALVPPPAPAKTPPAKPPATR